MSLITLQELINQSPPHAELVLSPERGEHEGPVTINRPLTLIGNGGTIWARRGVVVRVDSPGVVLRDLSIEVTTYADLQEKRDRTCLAVSERAGDLRLENVTVRGDVEGLAGEEQDWDYPRTLRLPNLQGGHAAEGVLRIWTGTDCRARVELSGAQVTPEQVNAGAAELVLRLEAFRPGALLRGSLVFESGRLARRVELVGRVLDPEEQTGVVFEEGLLLFETPRWPEERRGGVGVPAAVAGSDAEKKAEAVATIEWGNWKPIPKDPFAGPFLCPLAYDEPGIDPQSFGFPPALVYVRPEAAAE